MHLVNMHTVVMVLQPLSRDARLLNIVCHGRAAAAETEREVKCIAQDSTESAPERDVYDEVGRRVDD